MANLSTSGLEELIGGFDAIAEIPDEVVLEMLVAEAEVIAPAQEAEARAMLSGKYSTGETAQSISYDKSSRKHRTDELSTFTRKALGDTATSAAPPRSLLWTSSVNRDSPPAHSSKQQTRKRQTRQPTRRLGCTTAFSNRKLLGGFIMAQFGAKRPIFAPTKTTPDNALPTYDYEKVVTVGKLVKADLTVTNASGELYADDALAEKVDMFASGSLALETDDKTDEVHAAIHGATKDTQSSEVTDSDGDVAPRGGLCYYKVIIRGGVRYFKGVFHPLVKAILGNDSAATKGSSITFGTSATTFTVFRCNSGAWRITKEFTTESECIAWCDTKLGKAGG